VALTGDNTYSGDTRIRAGALAIGSASGNVTLALQNSTVDLTTGDAGTLRFGTSTSTTITSATFGGLMGSRNLSLLNANTTPAAVALTVGGNNSSTTYSGILSGAGGSLTKSGTGTLTLGNNQTYTGTTAVSGGTLNLSGGSLASTNYSVASTATLLISTSNEVLDTAAVTLSGGTIQRASGVSEVFGNLNITAASFLDFGSGTAGNLQFQSYTNTGSALVTVQNFFQGNSLQFASATFNSGNLAQFSFDNGYTTSIGGGYFTITAIPEPSTCLAAAGLLTLMLWPMRRTFFACAKRSGA
jgi:autotransporter-associated beta strand protein